MMLFLDWALSEINSEQNTAYHLRIIKKLILCHLHYLDCFVIVCALKFHLLRGLGSLLNCICFFPSSYNCSHNYISRTEMLGVIFLSSNFRQSVNMKLRPQLCAFICTTYCSPCFLRLLSSPWLMHY